MKKSKNVDEKRPIRYWMVDLELTSGEILQFYVKTLTIGGAYKKADEYAEWVSNEQLLNQLRQFKLMV